MQDSLNGLSGLRIMIYSALQQVKTCLCAEFCQKVSRIGASGDLFKIAAGHFEDG
jgi:hypothetical protein